MYIYVYIYLRAALNYFFIITRVKDEREAWKTNIYIYMYTYICKLFTNEKKKKKYQKGKKNYDIMLSYPKHEELEDLDQRSTLFRS